MKQPSSFRKRRRPRRPVPPPLLASPEWLVKALMELPETHTWVFMKGKSFRN